MCQQRQISQWGNGSVGGGGGESAVVIFGFRVGMGPVFAGYVRNRAVARGRRKADKMFQNKMGNLSLFCRRQRLNFFQNGLGFRTHRSNYTTPNENDKPRNM